MKHLFAFIFCLASVSLTAAQPPNPAVRPRVSGDIAAAQNSPTPRPTVTPTPSPTPYNTGNPRVVVIPSASPGFNVPQGSPTPRPTVSPSPRPSVSPSPVLPIYSPKPLLTLGQFRTGLTEAKRVLQGRPMPTAINENGSQTPLTTIITIAALDPKTNALHTISMLKTTFLTLYFEGNYVTSLGKTVRVRTLRANGVNTAVVIYDEKNEQLVPLVVQYPIERGGRYAETAYYTSAHPALTSQEIARAGQLYIRTTLETALKNLRERGKFISPAVVAEAEKLCLVEHVDHQRFLTENRAALYNEIFTLFALNEGNTYRYAVSTAGAGGVVQMIPATYRMVRGQHPNVPLMPDFVEGMRNHTNAMMAMLLYMQTTWNDLLANETIYNALENGYATDAELMAAGYNSNPARLPLYVRRSATNWRNLIPRETQMYLQIQKSIEATVKPLAAVK